MFTVLKLVVLFKITKQTVPRNSHLDDLHKLVKFLSQPLLIIASWSTSNLCRSDGPLIQTRMYFRINFVTKNRKKRRKNEKIHVSLPTL